MQERRAEGLLHRDLGVLRNPHSGLLTAGQRESHIHIHICSNTLMKIHSYIISYIHVLQAHSLLFSGSLLLGTGPKF